MADPQHPVWGGRAQQPQAPPPPLTGQPQPWSRESSPPVQQQSVRGVHQHRSRRHHPTRPTQPWAAPASPPLDAAGRTNPQPQLRWYRRGWVPVATLLLGMLVGIGMAGGGNKPLAGTGTATPRTVVVTSIVQVRAPSAALKATTAPAPATASAAARFGDGTWTVPGDVKPGTYRTSGGQLCSWARLRSLDGSLGAILANGNPSGPVTVTIRPTDKGFQSQGCGTWTKIG